MHLPHPRIAFFRIFYSTTFTLFSLLLTALLLITPGDHIYQAFNAGQLYHIIIVAGVYLLTFLLAVFIYASRLFSTRSALAGIPREWILGAKGKGGPGTGLGMGHKMSRVVREGLERSAIISYEGRPRDLRGEENVRHIPSKRRRRKGKLERTEMLGSVDSTAEPIWGTINHPGWSSPESPDLPNLHFEPVILELGHLIEAKAVSLVPTDPSWEAEEGKKGQDNEKTPVPDPMAVGLLQRPLAMDMRSYISHLTTLGMIKPAHLATDFLSLYERARFSGEEPREEEFRMLMAIFTEILKNMQPLDSAVVEELHPTNESEALESEDDGTTDTSRSVTSAATTKHTPQPQAYSSASSVASRSDAHAAVHTALSRPRNVSNVSKASSHSFLRNDRQSSLSSFRKTGSHASSGTRSSPSSAGSVIRLAEARTSLDLPHAFVNGSREALQ
ncbi:MAG: hypothetical protein Q9217_001215 [Psora testacea]